ncbi:ATP-dependent DNA helicase [Caerostris darwini]|uniref:ATP-dependent DNA helicase n=1 Tax=Caerostris darwini TaxID=1538125 RepID=A0AAV4N4U5_9ARAC|nr:ATP-dependent DNA helicase [Caerostris darwini]
MKRLGKYRVVATVVYLAVRLENSNRLCFTRENAETVDFESSVNTTATAFFLFCQIDPFTRKLLYVNVLSSYCTLNAARRFNEEKYGTLVKDHEGIFRSDALGRVCMVHPQNTECFYLQMLLNEIRGSTCCTDF